MINANQYTLSGFSKGNGGYGIAEGNAADVSVKIDLNSLGEMVYEAVIPLQSFTRPAFKAKAGAPISVGFAINALPKPAMGSGGGGYTGADINTNPRKYCFRGFVSNRKIIESHCWTT